MSKESRTDAWGAMMPPLLLRAAARSSDTGLLPAFVGVAGCVAGGNAKRFAREQQQREETPGCCIVWLLAGFEIE